VSFKDPHPSEESRAAMASPGVDPCKGMAKPAAGDASDSQHGLPLNERDPTPGEVGGVRSEREFLDAQST